MNDSHLEENRVRRWIISLIITIALFGSGQIGTFLWWAGGIDQRLNSLESITAQHREWLIYLDRRDPHGSDPAPNTNP